jgi:hypothetical protein
MAPKLSQRDGVASLKVKPTQEVTDWDVIGELPYPIPQSRSGCTANVVAPRANPRDDGPLYEQEDPLAPALKCGFCEDPDPGCGCWSWKSRFGGSDYSC